MARKPVLEGGKKDEIISAALKLFIENGYEGTSIRMIVAAVGGEIGMFYHYFNSKQEVFDKAFELFHQKQCEHLSSLMDSEDDKMTPFKRLEQLRIGYMSAISDYTKLSDGAIHWTVLSAMHEMTLNAMIPSFKKMLIDILKFAKKDDFSIVEWTAPFILKGISGLLHNDKFLAFLQAQQFQIVIELICRILDLPVSTFANT